jgi:hypothetical protein
MFAKNLTSGITRELVPAFPGGASRPELSRDGRTLAFVRRVRDKEALVLMYAVLAYRTGYARADTRAGTSRAGRYTTRGTGSRTT